MTKQAKEGEEQRLLNESILKKAKEDEEHRLRELMIKQAKEDEERKLKNLEDQRLKEQELVNNDMKKKIDELEYSLNQKESYISKKKQSIDASLKENERTKNNIKHKIEKMKNQEKEIHDMDYCLSSSHSLIDNEISQRKQINLQIDTELDLLNEEEMNIKEDMERFAKAEDDEDNKQKIKNILERNLNEKEESFRRLKTLVGNFHQKIEEKEKKVKEKDEAVSNNLENIRGKDEAIELSKKILNAKEQDQEAEYQ